MPTANLDLLPVGQAIRHESVAEPLAVTSPGKLCGISEVVPPLSRGRQQRVEFVGRVLDVYKEGFAEAFAPVTQDVQSSSHRGFTIYDRSGHATLNAPRCTCSSCSLCCNSQARVPHLTRIFHSGANQGDVYGHDVFGSDTSLISSKYLQLSHLLTLSPPFQVYLWALLRP